jgi:hypothetical protein
MSEERKQPIKHARNLQLTDRIFFEGERCRIGSLVAVPGFITPAVEVTFYFKGCRVQKVYQDYETVPQ